MNRRNFFSGLRDKSNIYAAFAFCCVFFIAGCLCAAAYSKTLDEASEAIGFLSVYRSALDNGITVQLLPFFLQLSLFIVAAFLSGLSILGVVLIPALSFARGFLLSLTSSVFVRVFGWDSVQLLFKLIGVSSVLTVPCFFVVAVNAFLTSLSLLRLSVTFDTALKGSIYKRDYFAGFGVSMLVSLLATVVQNYVLSNWVKF